MKTTNITFKDGTYSTDELPDILKAANANSYIVIVGKNKTEESERMNQFGKVAIVGAGLAGAEISTAIYSKLAGTHEPLFIHTPTYRHGRSGATAGVALRRSMEGGKLSVDDDTYPYRIKDMSPGVVDKTWERQSNNSTKAGFNENEIIKRRNKNKVARKSRRKNK